jgi:hypothetical protein
MDPRMRKDDNGVPAVAAAIRRPCIREGNLWEQKSKMDPRLRKDDAL